MPRMRRSPPRPGRPSGLHCLDRVVEDVWREGYSHHITRLMVLGNLATLFGLSPRQLTDWFWVAYVDAFDWVVEPNVLAMATYGTGAVMAVRITPGRTSKTGMPSSASRSAKHLATIERAALLAL